MYIITMKSTEAIPSSFVRPKLNERHCTQVQPLWMRVLEEKYQKLQLKIAQSTATMNGLYNATIGRSVYDNKLVRASLHRSKDVPQNSRRRPYKYEIKTTRISATEITNSLPQKRNEVKHSTEISDEAKVQRNSDRKNKFEISNNSSLLRTSDISDELTIEDGESDKNGSINSRGVRVSEILCLRYDNNKPHKKDLSEILKSHERNTAKQKFSSTKNALVLDNSRNMRISNRNVNSKVRSTLNAENCSSHHTISTQKTTMSSPVVSSVNNNNCVQKKAQSSREGSAGQARINRRKMKMFSRMSAEAQTAMTETILENESEVFLDSDDGGEDLKDETVIDPNENHIISCADINQNFKDKNVCNDSEVSMPSRDSRSIHTKLPDIPNDNQDYLTLRSIKPTDGRVPGIGKFQFPSKREVTFEITPPGFDIRYKDAPIREERESETPPPDIRDRAIRKCQDWLSRYTPRTPKSSQTSS